MKRAGEDGAALLTVLMLVAVMAVLTAASLEKLRIATRLSGNGGAIDQARAYAMAGETIATMRIMDLIQRDAARTTLAGDWHGSPVALPIDGGGLASARVTDGGNCFNLNSVVSGSRAEGLQARQTGVSQFEALMTLLEIQPNEARIVAMSLADWIDSDSIPQPGGAEDETYAKRAVPYRAANTLMADASELRVVAGVTPAIYAKLKPWICALPVTDLSPVNVNTIAPDRAPLLAMMLPNRLSIQSARAIIDGRPRDGFGSLVTFWKQPALDGLGGIEVEQQTKLKTRWFALELNVELAGAELTEHALIDAGRSPAQVVRRSYGDPA